MPNFKIKKKPTVVEVETTEVSDAAELLNTAMEEVADQMVERTEEVVAAKMCLLTKTHLMLEGKHGIAKSMLARLVFSRIEGMRVFNKQFMKTTQTDEIFGPMVAEDYKKGIWHHNTEGYLPTAHAFFADEVYRASDHVLPALMGTLNERTFFNGHIEEHCPLITAIGTTNFTVDTEELQAFHDRWHVQIECQPLRPGTSVRAMMRSYLSREAGEESEQTTVPLDTLFFLQSKVAQAKVPDDCLELADRVFDMYNKGMQGLYISDRRKCIALRFAQAQAVLEGRDEVTVDDLDFMRYGIIKLRVNAQEQAWGTAVANVVGTYQKTAKERRSLKLLEKHTAKLCGMFDSDMPSSEATALWKEAKKTLGAISGQTPDQMPNTPEGKNRQNKIVRQLEELLQSLNDMVKF